MLLKDLKEITNNINVDEYLLLYNHIRDNMPYKEWLGTFSREEIENILKSGGKIWMYYDEDIPVCSSFYIPSSNRTLKKHNVIYDEKETGSLGPIMIRKEYVGNGLQIAMMKVIDDYALSIGKKYMFTKAHSNNIYSINNILKDGYKLVDKYDNERGNISAFIKIIKE
jgi:hypothetical protein